LQHLGRLFTPSSLRKNVYSEPYRETFRERLERDVRAIHEAFADPILNEPDAEDLVLERLPSGEFAWLRPEPRYVLTDKGRAAIGGAA
jgi:hypothetical protein